MKTSIKSPKGTGFFKKEIRRIGFAMTARKARNLGVDFIDCYVAIFGKMPRHISTVETVTTPTNLINK